MTEKEKNIPVLNSIILGKDNEKIILILHGLYGNLDSWRNIGNSLSTDFCVHLIDLRNHGKSFHNDIHDYFSMAEDIKYYADNMNIKNFSIIGHSMGGKTAMFFAEKHQEMIDNLIIADISPRNYKSLLDNDPNINFHLNLISEIKKINLSCFSSYSEIENSLSNFKKSIKNLILKNIKKENGKFLWKININAIYNNFGEIFYGLDPENFIDKKINTRTLFLKGSDSDYIDNTDKKIINYIFPQSEIIEINGAGHWLHIDQPEMLKKEIKKFLYL